MSSLRSRYGECASLQLILSAIGNQQTTRMMASSSLKRTSSADRGVSPPPAKRKITNTTTTKTVANFFKPASEKEPEIVTYQTLRDSLIIARYKDATTVGRPNPLKVAAFDFDDTLVITKSGNRFAKSGDDWTWWHASVPARLKQLNDEGYAVVVVSNQAAISLRSDPKTPKEGMRSLNNFKGRVSAVLKTLALPITVYAATEKDLYRKPRVGMWERMLEDYGGLSGADLDREKCIFVGDAAGREGSKAAGIRKDHSCSDRDFAANVGIPFHTPEEFFMGSEAKPFIRAFEPKSFLGVALTSQTDADPIVFSKPNGIDLVLFCGSPGAGKSTFFWEHLRPLGYERVNQDTLKTRDKCMKAATAFIEDEGKSVAVDNTNADIETRAAWIQLARKLKVPIRLVHFTAPAKLCEHNDTVRALSNGLMNPESRTLLPKMAFTGFAARYREPKLNEGFEDIFTVDFSFQGTDEKKELWSRYWIS